MHLKSAILYVSSESEDPFVDVFKAALKVLSSEMDPAEIRLIR
jgi:hypothetical protein